MTSQQIAAGCMDLKSITLGLGHSIAKEGIGREMYQRTIARSGYLYIFRSQTKFSIPAKTGVRKQIGTSHAILAAYTVFVLCKTLSFI